MKADNRTVVQAKRRRRVSNPLSRGRRRGGHLSKPRPDLSPESVAYLKQLVKSSCERCQFYRAEKPGILQGALKSSKIPQFSKRGECPPGFENVHNECPAWDEQCACHGRHTREASDDISGRTITLCTVAELVGHY